MVQELDSVVGRYIIQCSISGECPGIYILFSLAYFAKLHHISPFPMRLSLNRASACSCIKIVFCLFVPIEGKIVQYEEIMRSTGSRIFKNIWESHFLFLVYYKSMAFLYFREISVVSEKLSLEKNALR